MINSPYEDYDLYGYFLNLVNQIPEGRVTSYVELARALGDQVAALACAYMQATLRKSDDAPFHRIVRASGQIAGFTNLQGIKRNSDLLREEGLTVRSGAVKYINEAMFNDFETDYPLESMREEQNRLSDKVSLEDDFDEDVIGAVDVSYMEIDGFGSMVFKEDGEWIERNVTLDASFPYIPGYLFYREYRFVKKLVNHFDGTVLIDGNGLLHPRMFGLASATGVCLNKATVGVAKSLLLGKIRRNWVIYSDRKVGYMLRKNTIISPGHRISLESSVDLIRERYDNSYPDILKRAHNNTVKLRKSYGEEVEA